MNPKPTRHSQHHRYRLPRKHIPYHQLCDHTRITNHPVSVLLPNPKIEDTQQEGGEKGGVIMKEKKKKDDSLQPNLPIRNSLNHTHRYDIYQSDHERNDESPDGHLRGEDFDAYTCKCEGHGYQ